MGRRAGVPTPEDRHQAIKGARYRAVVNPAAPALAIKNPCLRENLEVVADRWLGQAQGVREMANASFSIGFGLDQAE